MRILLFFLFLVAPYTHAEEIVTNAVRMTDAPSWLKRTRVEKITDRIQTQLEWTIRKIEVRWYKDADSFAKAHSLGPFAMAVTRKGDNLVMLGPAVNNQNFDTTFGHELVHIILGQKYKDAVPKWLEEGLANYLAKNGKADYAYLAKRPFPSDVRNFTHPYGGKSYDDVHYHYVASQALAEMIARKCDLTNLLRLSVERKLENYLETYCEIKDLNEAYRKWIKSKS